MERHKRIRLVLDNIDEVVGYLEKLKEAIRPEFHKREFTVYEVGVDIIQMCGSDNG